MTDHIKLYSMHEYPNIYVSFVGEISGSCFLWELPIAGVVHKHTLQPILVDKQPP